MNNARKSGVSAFLPRRAEVQSPAIRPSLPRCLWSYCGLAHFLQYFGGGDPKYARPCARRSGRSSHFVHRGRSGFSGCLWPDRVVFPIDLEFQSPSRACSMSRFIAPGLPGGFTFTFLGLRRVSGLVDSLGGLCANTFSGKPAWALLYPRTSLVLGSWSSSGWVCPVPQSHLLGTSSCGSPHACPPPTFALGACSIWRTSPANMTSFSRLLEAVSTCVQSPRQDNSFIGRKDHRQDDGLVFHFRSSICCFLVGVCSRELSFHCCPVAACLLASCWCPRALASVPRG